jgi:hypothetical protein
MHFLENAIFLENGPIFLENGPIFLENGLARFFTSERDRDCAPQPPNMCPKLLFCSNIVTGRSLRLKQSNYNSVSRGQSSIIQEFQVIILAQSGGMRAAGYSSSSCEPTSNPPIMSRSDSGSDASSSSSDGSEQSTIRDLVIPSPVEVSDSSDDGVSPSQHKLAMKNQLLRKNDPQKSSDNERGPLIPSMSGVRIVN